MTRFSTDFKMFYSQDEDSVTFPVKKDDSSTATLNNDKFWMGETEVTNAVCAAVYQWAYDNARFNTTSNTDPNYLSTTTVKCGNQELLDLDDSISGGNYCKINYDGLGHFTVDSGYDDHSVVMVSWYGAIIFCNWLTEMRDGNTDNVVYEWVDDGTGSGTASDGIWQDDETTEDVSKNGYRLPQSYEWEYAARYRNEATNAVWLYNNPWYTQGNSASDATADYTSSPATREVGWCSDNSGWRVHAVKEKRKNDLELYDMSGNVWEWCFTKSVAERVLRGGSFGNIMSELQIGYVISNNPDLEQNMMGFRLCRTR